MTTPARDRLTFPAGWSSDSCEVYQRLADRGKVTQADVDAAEAHLVWFREWRDYYSTTNGHDEIMRESKTA